MWDNIRIAFANLHSNRLRTTLTMLGITIGVAAVILLVSLGQGVEEFVVGEFTAFGSNLVMVFGKESTNVTNAIVAEDADFFVPLTESDAAAVKNPANVPDVVAAASAYLISAPISYGDRESTDIEVVGTDEMYTVVVDRDIYGRGLTADDVTNATRVAILGTDAADFLFEGQPVIGQSIRIKGVTFEVIGVWEELSTGFGDNPNLIAIIPITTAQERLGGERTVNGDYPVTAIFTRASSEEQVDDVITQISATLREEHRLDVDDENDFQIFSQTEFLDSMRTILGLLTVFLGFIAGISLLVGGIGIMNIMMVTVTERTKEIGLRKAVGAQNSDILMQFLVEAVTLAFIGGLAGTIIAVIGTLLATAAIPNLNVSVEWSSVLVATLISLGIGAFFGAFPANRAAQLNPIDALRYE
jgi:putative ABC transport system permease protein